MDTAQNTTPEVILPLDPTPVTLVPEVAPATIPTPETIPSIPPTPPATPPVIPPKKPSLWVRFKTQHFIGILLLLLVLFALAFRFYVNDKPRTYFQPLRPALPCAIFSPTPTVASPSATPTIVAPSITPKIFYRLSTPTILPTR